MEKLLNDGLLGIVTGILTAALLYFLNNFWQKTVKPFLVYIRYQGVKIDGSWFGSGENNDPNQGEIFKSECSLFLKQNAHDLSGSFLFKFQNDQKKFSIDFDVNGYMWEGYVTLNFTPRDKRITSYATTLLKLHDGGGTLVGMWLFRDVIGEFVNQGPLLLTRPDIGTTR
ncbi:hypothetical protein ACFPAG_05255 [Vogesella sp. GCM10023246]|uniref:Uncharacterized protein n=1 Tax=Vogesella oryzagri TaxID=3160864 RepID=A0ABV1M3T4_9NEIS